MVVIIITLLVEVVVETQNPLVPEAKVVAVAQEATPAQHWALVEGVEELPVNLEPKIALEVMVEMVVSIQVLAAEVLVKVPMEEAMVVLV